MLRLLFEKSGPAVWMSHLDLMRLFQRAFKRAGLSLKHTQGFNPRPSVSIALPLSVGVESRCELLDFDLEGEIPSFDEIQSRLNKALVAGVRVHDVYTDGRKIRDLSLLRCSVTLTYDGGVPQGAVEDLRDLFARETLLVEKTNKNGVREQDIIPMLRSLEVREPDGKTMTLEALVCCQNPTLNPVQLCAAIARYLPELQPDFAEYCRLEIYDAQEHIFR